MRIISEECASTWGRRNHGPQHPGFPPTLGTSAAPTGTTPATRTSSPASRPSAAILATHVTGGGRGRRALGSGRVAGSRPPPSAPAQSKAAPSVLVVIGRGVWRRSLASRRAGRPWARPPPGPHPRLLLFVSLAPSFSHSEGNVGPSSHTNVAARVSLLRTTPLAVAELPAPFTFSGCSPLWPSPCVKAPASRAPPP